MYANTNSHLGDFTTLFTTENKAKHVLGLGSQNIYKN